MTFIPETDRIAAVANPVLDEVAKIKSPEGVAYFSMGAGIATLMLSESLDDQRSQVIAEAVAAGFPAEFGAETFDRVTDNLLGILTPRLAALTAATEAAQMQGLINGLAEALGVDLSAVVDFSAEQDEQGEDEGDYYSEDDSLCGYGCCFEDDYAAV